MKLSRMQDRARGAARTARDVARKMSTPPGVEAVYAGNLDGEHLWLAVPADAGEPALVDRASGEVVEPVSDLPDGSDLRDSVRSVRWRLDDVVPPHDDAAVDVVLRTASGAHPAPVLVPPGRTDAHVRNPTTSDNRWRFVLDGRPGEPLTVRRTAVPETPRLLEITVEDNVVRVVCEGAGADADLLVVGGPADTTTRIAGRHTDTGFEARFTVADLPVDQGAYRVFLGEPDDRHPVMRRHTDLRVREHADVLLPTLTDTDTDHAAARLRFAAGGALCVQRLPRPTSDEELAGA